MVYAILMAAILPIVIGYIRADKNYLPPIHLR
jgi:hypothetical protein